MQEQRDDGGAAQIGVIHVAEPELDFVGDPLLLCAGLGTGDQYRIDLDADTARPVLPGRGDRNAAVSGPEIVDDIPWTDAGHLEHRADDRHGRGFEAHVAAGDRSACETRKQHGRQRDERQPRGERHAFIMTAGAWPAADGGTGMLSSVVPDTRDEAWLAALNDRHLANLTQSEVTRALRALSSCYVERRDKLATGGALDGAGKRAAFALFYGPQHFVLTRAIAQRLDIRANRVADLGCGTGAAGAAAAIACGDVPVEGFDLSPWAVVEAAWTYRTLGLRGRAAVANIRKLKVPAERGGLVLASYAINELPDDARPALLAQLMQAHARGASILVIEPIARRVNLWWKGWAETAAGAGGRADDWRFRELLPPWQRTLARGAGLDVQEMTARTLYLPGRNPA